MQYATERSKFRYSVYAKQITIDTTSVGQKRLIKLVTMMAGRKGGRFKAALPKVSFMRRKVESTEPKESEAAFSIIKDDAEDAENAPEVEEAPRQMTLDYLLGAMPQPDQRIKEGKIYKHGMDAKFHERYLILTIDALFLASSMDSESIKDCIPLCEIITIKMPDDSNESPEMKLLSDLSDQAMSSFEIQTRADGDCSGVSYIFAAADAATSREWLKEVVDSMHKQRARYEALQRMSGFRRLQRRARRIYNSMAVQMTVALLVFLNFLATAAQAEVGLSLRPASPIRRTRFCFVGARRQESLARIRATRPSVRVAPGRAGE